MPKFPSILPKKILLFTLLFGSFLLVALFPSVSLAAVEVDTSNASTATTNNAQRRTFFETNTQRYWAFYNNGTNIEYSYSEDGVYWNSAGVLAPNYSSSFSVTYKIISGTPYVFIALERTDKDIAVLRGVLSASSIAFDPEVLAFDSLTINDNYYNPSISLDSNNFIWVSTVQKGNATQALNNQLFARRSTNIATGVLSAWNPASTLGQATSNIAEQVLMPLTGGQMYLLRNNGEDNIVGFQFNGSWTEVNSGGDYGWINFAGNINNGLVNSIAIIGQNIFVGGTFTDLAGIPEADFLAMWDGSKWSSVGGGLNAAVRDLKVSGGELYIGGDFTNAGGNFNANRITKWDGINFKEIGGGLNNPVYSLEINGSNIYVGGTFTDAGGNTSADRIAFFDGTIWNALGTGISNGIVTTVAISGSDVYAGGTFTDAGGNVNADRIGRWNGAWNALGTGLGNTVNTIAINGANVFVGGDFVDAGGNVNADRIARWDGATWNNLGTGAGATVNSISISGSNLYIAGAFTNAGGVANATGIARWNGATWNALATGTGTTCNRVITSGSDVIVGGSFTTMGGVAVRLAKFDGSTWSGFGSALNNTVLAVAINGNDIYLGGSFTNAFGNPNADFIVRWDGSNWNAVGTNIGNAVNAIVFHAGELYITGAFDNAGGNANADRIARFNGVNWTNLGTGLNGNGNALLSFGGNLYVGGAFTLASGVASTVAIARWNGATWSAMGTGITGGSVNALTNDASNIFAGGTFTSAGGVANTLRIARWNGAWNALGTGLGNTVNALAVSGSQLYAGGDFLDAGGNINADRIARWDGATWNNLSIGLNSTVFSIAVVGSNIYVGGNFTDVDANPDADRIIRWNGTAWEYLGKGLNNLVRAILPSGNNLYMVGQFTSSVGLNTLGTSYLTNYKQVVADNTGGKSRISSLSDAAGNVHLFYSNKLNHLIYKNFNLGLLQWQTPVNLNLTGLESSLSLSRDTTDNSLNASWVENNQVKFKKGTAPYQIGNWNLSPTTIYSQGSNGEINTALEQNTLNQFGIWRSNSNSPYIVKASFISAEDLSTPAFVSANSSAANGVYGIGSIIPISLSLSEIVFVSALGGTPYLFLNSLAQATYLSGSGSNTLIFQYTVGAGQNSADLDYLNTSSLVLAGGQIKDLGGNNLNTTLATPGNPGSLSANKNLVIDTLAPATPSILLPMTGTISSNVSPSLSGTAEPNSLVTVYDGVTNLGNSLTDGFGNWSFITAALTDGLHDFKITATDIALNVSPLSSSTFYTVDTLAPAAPVVSLPLSGSSSNNVTPTLSGTAEANSTISIYDGLAFIGNTLTDGFGNWSFISPVLANGVHSFQATATDIALNTSSLSPASTYIVDIIPPAIPIITSPLTGTITSNTTPALSGTAEPNSIVTVYDGVINLGNTLTDGFGNWLYVSPVLVQGLHDFRITATDQVGNTSGFSSIVSITIDLTSSPAPTILSPTNGSISNINTPVISGIAEPNSTINIYDGITNIGNTLSSPLGLWTFNSGVLTDGLHPLSATATDLGNNVSAFSAIVNYQIDTSPPLPPIIVSPSDPSTVSDDTPLLQGTAEANSLITFYDGLTPIGTTNTDNFGNWVFTPNNPLSFGLHLIQATATDPAGNISGLSSILNLTIDALFTISGQVSLNDAFNTPLPGVQVFAGLSSGVTDPFGNFTITGVSAGVYNLTATLAGYVISPDIGVNPVTLNSSSISGKNFKASLLTNSPLFAPWNSFLGISNILEIFNLGSSDCPVTINLRGNSGSLLSQTTFIISANKQLDVDVNQLPGFSSNSYGLLELTFSQCSIGGRNNQYQISSLPDEYEFVIGYDLDDGSGGTKQVSYNTFQPSTSPTDSNALVANWLTVINLTNFDSTYTWNKYNASGLLLSSSTFTLPPYGRVDLDGGHQVPGVNNVGINEIVPQNPSAKYLSTLARYGYTSNFTRIRFATNSLASVPNDDVRELPISAEFGDNWLELVNASGSTAFPSLSIKNQTAVVQSFVAVVPPYAVIHYRANDLLGSNSLGSVSIAPQSGEKISSSASSYLRSTSGRILSTYTYAGLKPQGNSVIGTFNLFLGMKNFLKVTNTQNMSINIIIDLLTPYYSQTFNFTLAPLETKEFPLHDATNFHTLSNTYGTVRVSTNVTNSLRAVLLRKKDTTSGASDFTIATELR